VSLHEEASVEGNILFQDELYRVKLQCEPEDLEGLIPLAADQLTNQRTRTIKEMRGQDVTPWERRDNLQPTPGVFHMELNFAWTVNHVHRGSLEQTGSLTYFFKVIDKTRLGGEHPDYHTLIAALTQILEGIILSNWRLVCGSMNQSGIAISLEKYVCSSPSPEDILSKQIFYDLVTPLPETSATQLKHLTSVDINAPPSQPDNTTASSAASKPPPATLPLFVPPFPELDPSADIANQNLRLLTRDLLILIELLSAVEDGDIGRVEDLFPWLAMMFRGAGGTHYCNEILWLTLNLKHIWTTNFA
jgi:hypothetical protein